MSQLSRESHRASTRTPVRTRAHVFFAQGSATLRTRSRSLLASVAAWLRYEPERKIVLHAHANTVGRHPMESKELATARVHSVREALIAEGAPVDQIDTHAVVELHLPGDDSPLQRAICRRVDVMPSADDEPRSGIPSIGRSRRGGAKARTARR